MTPDMSLIKRLESATEGSRELDCDIWRTLGHPLGREIRASGMDDEPGRYICTEGDEKVPRLTTSLDAKLPWENITGMGWADGECHALHWDPETKTQALGSAHTEPLARRVAALRARGVE